MFGQIKRGEVFAVKGQGRINIIMPMA